MAYGCVKCGTAYKADVHEKWGQDGLGVGYGPDPRCVAIVPSSIRGPGGVGKSNQVCGGMLLPTAAHMKRLTAGGES